MTVLSPDLIGIFYYFNPAIVGLYFGILAPVYFYKVHSNIVLTISFPVWYVIFFAFVSYPDPFIKSLNFSPDIMEDFNGVMLYNIAFSVPVSILYFAWVKVPWFSELFLKKVPYYVMIGFQSYRICGVGYLAIYFNQVLEDFCMLWVGYCDLIISLTAIPLALLVKKFGLKNMKYFVMSWTTLGLADVGLSFILYFLNYLQMYHNQNSLAILMLYPITGVLFTFVVGVFFTHLVFLLNMDALIDSEVNAPAQDTKKE